MTSLLSAAVLQPDPRAIAADDLAICTGADNWTWADRLSVVRASGGEPFSDAAYATIIGLGRGFAKVSGAASASDLGQADDWRIGEAFWETTTAVDGFGRAYSSATVARSEESNRESFRMFVAAVRCAWAGAMLTPRNVTHFVPQASDSGQPFRLPAKVLDVPWHDELHEHDVDHGYFGASTHVDGLVYLAETSDLKKDSIVLVLTVEYRLSATAIFLKVTRLSRPSMDRMVRVIS